MIPLHTMAGPLPLPTHRRRGNMPPPPSADESIPSNDPRFRDGPAPLVPGTSSGYAPPRVTPSSSSSSYPFKMDDEKSSSPNEATDALTAVNTSSTGQTRTKRLRPYASKTCSECRRRKIACVPSDAAPNVCKRCYRMDLVCTLADEVGRGDKKRSRRKNPEAGGSGTQTSVGSATSGPRTGQNDEDEDDEDDDDDDGQDSAEKTGGVNSNFASADFYHQPAPNTPLGPPGYYSDPRYPMAGPSSSSPYAYPPPSLPPQRTTPSARTPPAFSRSLSLSAPSQRQARPHIRSSIAASTPATSGPLPQDLPAPRGTKLPSSSASGASSSAKSARATAPTAEYKRKAEEGPDTDFIYSIKEEKDLPTSRLRSGSGDHPAQAGGNAHVQSMGNAVNQGAKQVGEGDSHRANRQMASHPGSGSAGTVATTQASSSLQAQRALVKAAEDAMSAQSAMLVHGCPVWVYSDLMARFRLLEGLVTAKAKSASAKISVAGLNAKLADIAADVVDSMDEILEESRLTMPHLPLLRKLISRQEQQHDPGRFLLAILLVFIASNGGTPGHVPHLPRQLLIEIKAFLAHQALDIIMISPTKSRELIIAIEVLAVYDPLLGHAMSSRPQTSWFVVPSSFYLEMAVGYAYRLGIVESVRKLQRWCQQRRDAGEEEQGKGAAAAMPLPADVSNLLMDATIWVSLELHTAELCRNLQGVTNCFARDWEPLWPDAVESNPRPPSMAEVVRCCCIHLANSQSSQRRDEPKSTLSDKAASPTQRSPPADFPTLGSRLGLVNLAFRQDGLILVQEILKTLYDGIPSVAAIDSNYVRLEKDLSNRLKDYAGASHQKIITSSGASEAETKLITLSGQIFERELAWMKHFYGGYCFAILLWVPKLKKKSADADKDGVPSTDVAAVADAAKQTAITAAKSTADEMPAAAAKSGKLQESGTGTPSTADGTSEDKSTTKEERDSDNEAVGRNIHEHGIHGSDIAKSVIDAIKSQHSNPDAMTGSGRTGEDNTSEMEAKSGRPDGPSENSAVTQAEFSDFTGLTTAMKANTHASPPGAAASIFANASSPTSTTAHKSMSSFDFLMKHTPEHEQGVIRWLTLSLSTTSSLRSGNIHRIPTNSRTIYVCKEIIENHATRKRGWGKVGDEAVIHTGLLKQACDHFKDGDNVLDRSLAKLTKILEKILDGWRKVNKVEQGAEQDAKGSQQSSAKDQAENGHSTGSSAVPSSSQTATSSLMSPSRLVGGHTKSHSRKLSSSNLRSTSTGDESDPQRQIPSYQSMHHGLSANQLVSEQPPWHNQQQQPMQYSGTSYAAFQGQPPHQPPYPGDGGMFGQGPGYAPGEHQQNPPMSSLTGDPRIGQQLQQSPGGPSYRALNGPGGSFAGGMNRQTAPYGSYQQPQQPHSAPAHSEWAMQQQQQYQPPPTQHNYGSGDQSNVGGAPMPAGWQSHDHPLGHQSHDASNYTADPSNQLQAPMAPNSINTPGSTTNSLSNFDLGLTNLLDMDIFSTDLDNDWTLNDSLVGASGSNAGAPSTEGSGGYRGNNSGNSGNALDVESLFMNYWPRLDWGLDGSGGGANGGAGDGMMTAAADMGSELFMAMGGGANSSGDGKAEGPNAGWLSNAQ